MSLYDEIVPQLVKMLGNLERWLDDGVSYAEERGFEADQLLEMRLYADMFPLVRQVGAACDAAKFTGARLAGVDAPVDEDDESTMAQIRERIAGTVRFLEGLDPADFEGAAERMLTPSMLRGGSVTGADYLREFGAPNFYFHLCMCYAILRNSGVKLGKRAYIGSMNVVMPEG